MSADVRAESAGGAGNFLASLPLVQWIVALVLGAAGAWGAIQFTQGAVQTRLAAAETTITSNREERVRDLRDMRAQMVTREEWNLLKEDLREIKTDLREIRQAVRQDR